MSVKRKPIWHHQVFPLRPDQEEVLPFRKPPSDFLTQKFSVYEQDEQVFNRNRLTHRQVAYRQASFRDHWIDEELTFSMNKLSLVSLVFGLMLLGVLFFITGFLVALSTVGPRQAETPTAAAIWSQGGQQGGAAPQGQQRSSVIGRMGGSLVREQTNRVESKFSGGAGQSVVEKVPAPFQPFVAQAQLGADAQAQRAIEKPGQLATNALNPSQQPPSGAQQLPPGAAPAQAGPMSPPPAPYAVPPAAVPPQGASGAPAAGSPSPGVLVVPNYAPSSYTSPSPQYAQSYPQQTPSQGLSVVHYTLQIAVYDQEASAIRQMNELRQNGHQAYLYPSKHTHYGTVYYLRSGHYLTHQEAEAAASAIRYRYQRQPQIIPISQAS